MSIDIDLYCFLLVWNKITVARKSTIALGVALTGYLQLSEPVFKRLVGCARENATTTRNEHEVKKLTGRGRDFES